MEIGVTRQNDAYKISVDENYYTKCFHTDKKSVKGNEECVKVDTLIKKKQQKHEVVINLWCLQIHINPL